MEGYIRYKVHPVVILEVYGRTGKSMEGYGRYGHHNMARKIIEGLGRF